MTKKFGAWQLMLFIICFVCAGQRVSGQQGQKAPQEMPPKVTEKIAPVTVKIICNPGERPGSGVIIAIASTQLGDFPLILTACHVISSNDAEDVADLNIPLEYYDDIQISIASELASVQGKFLPHFIDRANDIAIITTHKPVNVDKVINYTTKLSQGQRVAAFGFPGTEKLSQVVGIINREEGNYYVFDAGISGGYSGGPLVDDKGRMVGMTVFKTENAEGYAIKINLVATVVNNWLQDKSLRKAFWQKEGDGSIFTKPYVYIPGGLLIGGGVLLFVNSGNDQTATPFGLPPNPPPGN